MPFTGGISFQLMRETARQFTQPPKRGVHYGFFGGKAWMLTPSHFPRMGHVRERGQAPWTGTAFTPFDVLAVCPRPQNSVGTHIGLQGCELTMHHGRCMHCNDPVCQTAR